MSVNLTNVYNLLSPHLTEFKTASFYEYTLDGDGTYIYDGGGDMYDGGNRTTIINGTTTTSSDLNYAHTTPTDITVTSSVKYVSLGYALPLIMLATSNTRGNWGFRKTGDLGSDGATGSYGNTITIYDGSVINGYTVYATAINWWATNQADPAICDVYFSIGNTSSVYYSTTQVAYHSPSSYRGDVYESYVTMDSANTLFGCMLLSKQTTPNVSVPTSEIQTVITALVTRLQLITPTLGSFDMTRTFGDSAFIITQPTSDNTSGAFTYSVTAGSDVISISGTTITITRAGTATVQSSQAASGNYLLATKTALITINRATPTLVTSQSIIYRKFVSGATFSFDFISSSAGAVSRNYESTGPSPLIITIPTASAPSASIVASGKTTIKVTQPQTTNYAEVVNNSIITIVIIGQGQTYTSETFSSVDLSGANLSGSIFSNCTLTDTNLFGTTVSSTTNFTSSTLKGIMSGKIIGTTDLLPPGFKMI